MVIIKRLKKIAQLTMPNGIFVFALPSNAFLRTTEYCAHFQQLSEKKKKIATKTRRGSMKIA